MCIRDRIPREAFYSDKNTILFEESAGKICGEMIMAYPPGIPIITPGERITEEIIDYIKELKEAKLHIQGMADPEPVSYTHLSKSNSLASLMAVIISSALCTWAFTGISFFITGIRASSFISNLGFFPASLSLKYSFVFKIYSLNKAAIPILVIGVFFLSLYVLFTFSPKADFIETESVSYTHLDVYKRKVKGWLIDNQPFNK